MNPLIPMLMLLLGLLAWPGPALGQPAAPEGMVRIEGGTYTPLYRGAVGSGAVQVADFYLNAYPVTNADFLAFVEANPEWRRSQVKRLFADKHYLEHWAGDLELGDAASADRPVVNVSWFAAQAYADWQGTRLPTVAEWEYAASASATQPNGRNDADYDQRILQAYSRRASAALPAVGTTARNYWGVYDLHGLVWEWTEDFNSALVTGESRNNTDLDVQLFCGSASLGASDFTNYAAFIRFALRSSLEADYTVRNVGFRTAADAPNPHAKQTLESNHL